MPVPTAVAAAALAVMRAADENMAIRLSVAVLFALVFFVCWELDL